MAVFDAKKAAEILGNNGSTLNALGVAFGVPNCIMDLTRDAMSLIPAPVLAKLQKQISGGKSNALQRVNDVAQKFWLSTGLIQRDTEDGDTVLVGNTSYYGIEEDEASDTNNLGALATAINLAKQGAQIYTNIQNITQKANQIADCFDNWGKFVALESGSAFADKFITPNGQSASGNFNLNLSAIGSAKAFIDKANQRLNDINSVILDRLKDPSLEPIFLSATYLSGTSFITTSASLEESKEIFSLDNVGPPASKQGQFILSKTGLYFDSQSGGLELPDNLEELVVVDIPDVSKKWLFEFNPNYGGKGDIITLKDLNIFTDTIFDLDNINESASLEEYYAEDHFLQTLISQGNKQIFDLSSHYNNLIASGYSPDSALGFNAKQQIYSQIAVTEDKIRRRKKQIEITVSLSPEAIPVGKVPINDFTFLDDTLFNLNIEKQKKLVFDSGEVSSVVLPINPKFSKKSTVSNKTVLSHLNVPLMGKGSIITGGLDASSESASVLSLNDLITSKGLFAIYNFLDSKTVLPDSLESTVLNCATEDGVSGSAKFLGYTNSSIFVSGLCIPKLHGICSFFGETNTKASLYSGQNQYLYSPHLPSGAVVLPQTDQFQSLFYNTQGATIDFWIHAPGVLDSSGWADAGASSLHRLVLANENRGGTYTNNDSNLDIPPLNTDTSVRGIVMGLTRDRRLISQEPPSNDPADNLVSNGIKFYIAPTQSVNTSDISFLSKTKDLKLCETGVLQSGYFHFGVNLSSTINDKALSSMTEEFVHLVLTVDYDLNKIKLYCDSQLMGEETIRNTFGWGDGPPRAPSPIQVSSFSYSGIFDSTLPEVPEAFIPGSIGQSDFWYWNSPKPEIFTPWILGGGYTDGMTNDLYNSVTTNRDGMNFMGKFGGIRSGLNGFLGSIKFYSRPITQEEVTKNYNAQRGFFKNIKT